MNRRRTMALGMLGGGAPVSYTTHINDAFIDADGTVITNHVISPTNLLGASWIHAAVTGVHNPTIYNNRLEFASVFGNYQIAYFDSLQTDLTILATWRVTANDTYRGSGLIGRCATNGNGWIADVMKNGAFQLSEISGWASPIVRASTTVTPVANTNYDFSLNFNGQVITAIFNGISITYTSSLYQTQTRVGVRNYNGTLDNFQIITPPT